ncbi:MAG: SDR family oxidoreductase [Holophaga sp.]
MPSPLAGKRCLITGASRGLGRELARELARVGGELFLTARDEEALARLGTELQATWAAIDLADAAAVDHLAEEARSTLGGIDALINCAGVFPVSTLADTDLATYDHCFSVNVRAPFQLCRAFAPDMAQRRWGRLVNIGSSSAYAGYKDTSVYCASKHALLGFSRALHDEFKAHNVRCYCVSPGSIQTDMGRHVRGQDFSTFLDPVELATFIVELISQDGPMITEELRVNRMVIR